MSDFLAARAGDLLQRVVDAVASRQLPHYQKLGREASEERVRALLSLVIDGARSRDLGPIVAHAERIARERHAAGFDFVEVQGVINLLEEEIWYALLGGYPQAGLGEALGVVSTLLGAAKDKLASTYVTLATGTHMPTLDLQSLFRGTQNTGGGEVG